MQKDAGMKTESKQNTNVCNGTIFDDHSVIGGHRISCALFIIGKRLTYSE